MRFLVFTKSQKVHKTLINPETIITQWKFLLWSDYTPWEDTDDGSVADTPEAVTAEYMLPNGIYPLKIGRIGGAERTYWIEACPTKSAVSDFYSEGDAGADDNLAWRTFYTFTHADGTDCISADFEYICEGPVRDVIRGLRSMRT